MWHDMNCAHGTILDHPIWMSDDAPPSSLMDSTSSWKVKITEREGVGARCVVRNTLEVEGHVVTPGWD
jgi:hypothetical protein